MPAQTEEMVPAFAFAFITVSLASGLATDALAKCGSEASFTGKVVEGGTSVEFQLQASEQRYVMAGLHSDRPLAVGRETLSLHPISGPDRYGRTAVLAATGDSFLQQEWLEAGKAIVYGRGLTDGCLEVFRKAEDVGRAAKRGWWGENSVFSAQNPARIAARQGRFAVVSGRILSVGNRKRRLYLNFGQNWAEDFTVSVAKTGAGRFNGNVDELIAAKGRRVEIRGLVELARGPLIRLFHVSQIRFLDEPAKRR